MFFSQKAPVFILLLILIAALAVGCGKKAVEGGDPGKELYWHIKAAEKGSVSAQALLGAMYYTGDGVPKDLKKAYAWYHIAAGNGDAASIQFRDAIKTLISAEQLSQAEQMSEAIMNTIIRNNQ